MVRRSGGSQAGQGSVNANAVTPCGAGARGDGGTRGKIGNPSARAYGSGQGMGSHSTAGHRDIGACNASQGTSGRASGRNCPATAPGGGVCTSGHTSAGKRGVGARSEGQGNRGDVSRAEAANRSNQMNPNHVSYHKSRGFTDRPAAWEGIVDDRRNRGQRELIANMAAAESDAQRAAHARDVVRVERVVKEALGGPAQVLKGGSRNKHNNLAGADLDIMFVAPGQGPIHSSDRDAVGQKLKQEFGSAHVSEDNPRIHVVQGEGGPIDVVPFNATFFPGGHHAGLPRDGFKYNPKARLAVRDVKRRSEANGMPIKGHAVEEEVLRAQQTHPGETFNKLSDKAFKRLLPGQA